VACTVLRRFSLSPLSWVALLASAIGGSMPSTGQWRRRKVRSVVEEQASVVRTYQEALQRGDVQAAAAVLADDVVFTIPGRNRLSGDYVGKRDVVDRMLLLLGREFTPLTVSDHDIVASDNHVVVLWTLVGSLQGRELDAHGATVFHVAAGKITRGWVLEGDQHAVDQFFG
jgi:uncharacterized protein